MTPKKKWQGSKRVKLRALLFRNVVVVDGFLLETNGFASWQDIRMRIDEKLFLIKVYKRGIVGV